MNDRQELAKAVMRYKSNLESANNRNKQARNALNEARVRTQKMQALAKQAQKAVAVFEDSPLVKQKSFVIGSCVNCQALWQTNSGYICDRGIAGHLDLLPLGSGFILFGTNFRP